MIRELNDNEKNIIKEYIDNSKIKAVETIDFNKKVIKYNSKIGGKKITSLKGDEEIVRAFIITKLVNELGYPLEKIEIEHEYMAGRPNTNVSIIDLVVRDKDDNAFLFIELKSPKDYASCDKDQIIEDQLFRVAGMEEKEGRFVKYLVLYTIDIVDEEIKDECIIIDNEKFNNFSEWEIRRDYLTEIPKKYGRAQKTPYIKGSKKDLETKFNKELLDNLREDLHNVLWGGGGTDDNDIFSSLTNLILAKIQDEDEKSDGDIYDFQALTYEKSEDNKEDYESLETLYDRINELYRRALKEKLNITDPKQLEKSYVVDTNKFSLSKVKYTVQALEKYSFVDGKNSLSGKDILGDFFEGIIRTGFKQSKGQFFTHINIVKFMLWAIQADRLAIEKINKYKELPYMIDPSAGSGTFLIEYMKFITENIKHRFRHKLDTNRAVQDKVESDWFYPDHRENKWAREYIYGCELNFNLGTSTKVNMILHGDGSSNIFVGAQKGDGLLPFNEYIKPAGPNVLNKEVNDRNYSKIVIEQFDIILTNPPFSVDLDNETKKKIKKSFIYGDKKNSENLFIERYYQLLKENGRLGAILPDSVFDTTENKYIRLFIYKYFNVKAVVSLPQLAFAPYTNTKTSILFAQKKTKEEVDKWNELWAKYSKEYNKLKTRVENLLAVFNGKKEKDKLPSIKNLNEEEIKNILIRFLAPFITDDDKKLSSHELINKYQDELSDLCTYDNDTMEELGHVNTWWVFNEVSKELNYNIFMVEVDHIGYKRSKRGEKKQPNELFREDVDDGIKETVLDYMREIPWKEYIIDVY